MKKLLNGNKNVVVSIKFFLDLISLNSYLELTFQLAIGGGTIINSSDDSKYISFFFVLLKVNFDRQLNN
jgi:hypothetical protein